MRTSATSIFPAIAVSVSTTCTFESKGTPTSSPDNGIYGHFTLPRQNVSCGPCFLTPNEGWKLAELARTARVSLGQASNVKKLLEDREWLQRSIDGIRLVQPGKLIQEWSESYSFRKNKSRDFYSTDEPPQIKARLATVCEDLGLNYALAGFSAAARFAPSVRYQRVMAYVSDRIDEVAQRVELKPVASGPNVTLFEPYDEGVLAGIRDVDNIRITSPIQTYLDLREFRGAARRRPRRF